MQQQQRRASGPGVSVSGGSDDGEMYTERRLTMFESMTAVQVIVGILCIIHVGLMVYLFGGIFSLLKFQREYTGWVTPPPPGSRIMASWSHYWYFYPIAALLLQLVVVPFVLFTLNNVYSRIRVDVARLFVTVGIIVNGLVFAALVVMWVFSNSSYFPFNPASSDDYCLAFYGSVAASGHCRNIADAVGRPSATIVLGLNETFKQLFATTIVSGAVLCGLWYFVDTLRSYSASVAATGVPDKQHLLIQRAVRNTPGYLRWPFTILMIVYVLTVMAYFLSGPLLLDIRHTTQYPATGPIGVQSGRTGLVIAGLVCLATALLVPSVAIASIRFIGARKPSQVFLGILLTLFALHCFGLMSVSQARTNANKPGQPNNPGNSERYCCVPEIYNDPASQCDNAVACPGGPATIEQLVVNDPHTTIFAFAFVFLGLDIVTMTLVYLITMWNTPPLDPLRRQISAIAKPTVIDSSITTTAIPSAPVAASAFGTGQKTESPFLRSPFQGDAPTLTRALLKDE